MTLIPCGQSTFMQFMQLKTFNKCYCMLGDKEHANFVPPMKSYEAGHSLRSFVSSPIINYLI